MPKVKEQQGGKTVSLTKSNFIAQGGEGAVYIIGDWVYKYCVVTDPDTGTVSVNMIPQGKLAELCKLDHKAVIVPSDTLIAVDGKRKGDDVGYKMRAVPGNPLPLAQILTKGFREREGITHDMMSNLVLQGVDGIKYIHSAGGTVGQYLQVDGNELNYMVTDDFKQLFLIDTNSYQTPSYPADAIMLSVRDHTVRKVPCEKCKGSGDMPERSAILALLTKNSNASQSDIDGLTKEPCTFCGGKKITWGWNELSDAYSFAIISFYMFTGIHPFKGRHPKSKDPKTMMVDNMKYNRSVLDADSMYPTGPIYHPFADFVPGGEDGAFFQWYKAIFVDGKRLSIPDSFQAKLSIAFVPKVKTIAGTNRFVITPSKDVASMITRFVESNGHSVITCRDQIYVDGVLKPKPNDRFRVGFTSKMNVPVAMWLDSNKVVLQNLQTQKPIPIDVFGRDMMSCEGRLYTQGLNDIFEITYMEHGGNTIGAANSIANIMPNATSMFRGVIVQDMLGATMISMFPAKSHHQQIKIDELNEYRITDAKYEGGVLMVVGLNKSSSEYSRFIFRFDENNWNNYDCRTVENITPVGLNFTVSDKGLCVCIDEEDRVEIFTNQKDHAKVTQIEDPAIKGDMRLYHSGSQIKLAYGDKLYDFSMAPTK